MKKLMLLALLVFVFFSCTKDYDPVSPEDQEPDFLTEKNTSDFREANLNFANDIFKEIVDQSEADENIMISPLSISIALSMLNNGSAGNTKDEIKNVLKLDNLSDYCVNNNFSNLIEELEHYNNVVELNLANSAWFDNQFSVKQEFIDVNKEYYDAEIRNLDLGITSSIDTINTWVSEKTDGKIEDILTYEDIDHDFFLINAINFQGFWKCPFDAGVTEDQRFNYEDGTYSLVPTMMTNIMSEWIIGDPSPIRKFSFLYHDDFKAVKIPYGKENTASLSSKNSYAPVSMDNINMYIFVPVNDLKPFIENELNVLNWNDWMNRFLTFDELYPEGVMDFEFTMPKFSFGNEIKLIPILENMGMIDAFIPGIANFSGITDNWEGLFIDLVKHKTFIEVNEEGTSAAGVTVIGGGYSFPPPEFLVDKPFFFAIRDDLTGTILFMGQVYDPQY